MARADDCQRRDSDSQSSAGQIGLGSGHMTRRLKFELSAPHIEARAVEAQPGEHDVCRLTAAALLGARLRVPQRREHIGGLEKLEHRAALEAQRGAHGAGDVATAATTEGLLFRLGLAMVRMEVRAIAMVRAVVRTRA